MATLKTCRKGSHLYEGRQCQECRKAAVKRWKAANPDKVSEHRRKWMSLNPEKHREHHNKWATKNPAKVKARAANNSAREWGADGTLTEPQLLELLLNQTCICVYCPSLLDKWSPDHKVPLSRNGSNHIDNIQLLCEPCNLDKNNLTHEEYEAVLQVRSLRNAVTLLRS